MFKIKKLKRTLEREFKKRYDQLEERYLNMEGSIYITLESRLGALEDKFDELSDLLKEEILTRKERNEERQSEKAIEMEEEDDGEALSDKIAEKVQDVREDINEKVEGLSTTINKGVKKAREILEEAIEEVQEKRRIAEADKEEATETTSEEVVERQDDLTKIKGLGAKFAEKLRAEGVTSFEQLAKMSKKDRREMDTKIKSFAARYERYDWGKQAKKMK